jgi:stage IV sporulation protein FB
MQKKTKLSISLFGVLMIISLFFTHSYLSLAALAAAFIHELAHIAMARAVGVELSRLRLDIFGASLMMSGEMSSYKKEAAVAIAGPLSNIILFFILLPFSSAENEYLSLFMGASLFLGLLNLLPIKDLDGGRVLFCTLASLFSLNAAQAVLRVLSFLTIFSLWSLSVYLILRLGASLSLFVFSSALFCKTFLSGSGGF